MIDKLVSLAESRILQETGFWVCLWGNIFSTLPGLGRPAHHRWHHSLAGILSPVSQKKSGSVELLFSAS